MSPLQAYPALMDDNGPRPTLSAIITAARAGSLDHASALFAAGGHDRDLTNPAALAVGARLLKDRALRARVNEARALFAQAAAAYAQAYTRDPQPYTRINQATLTLLSGDAPGGQVLARDLLVHLDAGETLTETLYFLAACDVRKCRLGRRIETTTGLMHSTWRRPWVHDGYG